jgi:ABC transporter substrate binding protein
LRSKYHWAEGVVARPGEIAAEYAQQKVDVIVVSGDAEVLAAKRATAVIPIVIAASADPVGNGLVESLARPGGNVTCDAVSPFPRQEFLKARSRRRQDRTDHEIQAGHHTVMQRTVRDGGVKLALSWSQADLNNRSDSLETAVLSPQYPKKPKRSAAPGRRRLQPSYA